MFIAIVMATLWLPMTQHCGLEAVGMFAAHCADEAGATACADGDCADDGCATLEDGNYRSDNAAVTVSAPEFFVCFGFDFGDAVDCESEADSRYTAGDPFARPREWVPTWQFERRAAAPAHAPDSLIA
jgi:hypothetical protein